MPSPYNNEYLKTSQREQEMFVKFFDWKNVDTVLFDMDGTLLDLHFDNVFWLELVPKQYAKQNNMNVEHAKTHLYEQFAQQHGKLNWYCVDYWTEQLGFDIAELKKELVHLIQIRPNVENFLLALKKANKKIYLVTNAHHKSLSLKMDHTGLAHYFDKLITSHQYGVAKEHVEFWPQLQLQLQFDKARTLFIDDSMAVLDSAKRFGIAYLLAIAQPDSQQAVVSQPHYSSVECFSQIMPD